MLQFSVIIPNLHSPVIQRTLDALEAQAFDHQRYEVIVVGMDCHNLVQESPRVRFDRSDYPLNPAQARNRGVHQAQGEILAFTDADCIPHRAWLATLAAYFSDAEIAVIGGGVNLEDSNYWTTADNVSMFYPYLASHPPGDRQLLPSLNLALRRSVFEALGGFDERRPAGEDSDLSIRLRRAGCILYFRPDASVTHLPPRNQLRDLLRHHYHHGRYSIKVDDTYRNSEGIRGFAGTRVGLILLAPLLSAGVLGRIFRYPNLRRYCATAPAIYLAKLAWCLGAANHPKI